MVKVATVLALLAVSSLTLFAADCTSQTNYVMDFAKSLPEGTVKNLNVSLKEHSKRYGVDIFVLIFSTLEQVNTMCTETDYDDYGQEFLTAWDMGGEKNDGAKVVLFYISDDKNLIMIAHTSAVDALFKKYDLENLVFKKADEYRLAKDKESRQRPLIVELATLMDALHFSPPDLPITTAAATP